MKPLFVSAILFLLMTQAIAQVDFDKKLKELGIELYAPTNTMGNYVKVVRSGKLLFFSGHGPTKADNSTITGKIGKDLTWEQGFAAARLSCVSLLSTLKAEVSDLNKVKQIVKVTGMLNCTDKFADHAMVMNGFSNLIVAIFGDKGKHARSAVGMNSLPNNIAIEIEMVVELE